MNRPLLTLIFALLLTGGARADATAQKNAMMAQTHYDAQRYSEAAQSYELVLKAGLYSPEIFFNLGNAYFKSHDLAHALLNYRRAWYFTPNDPDLQSNMKLAAKTAGITLPEESWADRILLSLPQERWVKVALIAYLSITLLVISAITSARGRNTLLKCAALPLTVALMACFGIYEWHQLYQKNEQAALHTMTAKFGPTDSSTDHFSIPAGSIIKMDTLSANGWREINLNHTKGWVKKNACEPVIIWSY